MKRTLLVLNRLKAWCLDQERRALAEAAAARDQAEKSTRELAAEIAKEQECAANSPLEAGRAFAAYALLARGKMEDLQTTCAEARAREAAVRQALHEAFLECKRTEVLTENLRQRREAEAKAAEMQSFDEIAVGRFARRREDT